jgi:hypothetical protein
MSANTDDQSIAVVRGSFPRDSACAAFAVSISAHAPDTSFKSLYFVCNVFSH